MNPEAYGYILAASVAGALGGALVMWSRRWPQLIAGSRVRRWAFAVLAAALTSVALFCFARAFGTRSLAYAAMVIVLITGLAALLVSFVQLGLPARYFEVHPAEYAFSRVRWTGVRLFGGILRHTPLRHLGGRVYLAQTGRDPLEVLKGLQSAETVHLWGLLMTLPWLVVWVYQGWWPGVLAGSAIHVPLNVYPILHLRYVRWRIQSCAARKGRRSLVSDVHRSEGG